MPHDDIDFLLFRQRQVVSRAQALRFMTAKALQHRLERGQWRAVHRAVYLAGPGPLADDQRPWVATLATGGVLAGVSALAVLGLRGFPEPDVHVLLPHGRKSDRSPIFVVMRRTRHLEDRDIWLGALPCTAPARSVVDAAQWARSDDHARAIVAAAFQQGRVWGDDVHEVLHRLPAVRRRPVIAEAASDARDGAHSLPESEFLRLCKRNGLPKPTLQVRRTDASGRRRYLDALFEEYGVHVEIDGGQHTDVRTWWADMKRQNELWIPGDRVLRFPAWVVRRRPAEVVVQVRAALTAAGWRP